MRSIVGLALLGGMVVSSHPLRGDQLSVADAARKLSGTWAFNQGMSPTFVTPGSGHARGRGGALFQAGSAVPAQPRFPQGIRPNPTNTEPTSSGASDLTPTELAERNALRQLGQVPPTLVIDASESHVVFSDDRSESECDINGRTAKLRVFGTYMDVKCRWDKGTLRQEFSNARTKLIRAWTVDNRDLLVLTLKVEGIDRNSPEATAYFDRVR